MMNMSNFCGGGDITKIYIVGAGGTGSTTNTDIYVTGFTYDNSILTISQNGGQPNLNVILPTFITGSTDYYVTGGTYSNGTLTLDRQNGFVTITGLTTTFTGNTSGDCITDLFVTNVNSCSPLHIQPNNLGDVYIGENGGVNVGIGTTFPSEKLEVSGKTKTTNFQMTNNANNGYILTSDGSGNASWNPLTSVSGYSDNYVTGFTFNTGTYDLTILQNNGLPSLTQNLGILAGDITVTGGTYNPNDGVATFYNNIGGSFQVSGFLTGFTDIYLTSGSFNPNNGDLTLTRTDNVNVVVTGVTDYYVTGGTYSNGTLTLERQNGSINVTGFSQYFISGSTPTGTTINYGDRWYNTNNGIELVYINDGDNDLWVQPSSPPGPPGYSNLMITSSITTSAATLNIDTNYYGVNYNGNVDISLPNPSGYDGYNINIKDEIGNAGIYRIRLTPLSGLIDGNNYVDMNINYMSLHVVARNNNWWII